MEKDEKEEKVLLTFLKQTREGKYAKIDKNSLPYYRLKEKREESYIRRGVLLWCQMGGSM